MCRSSRRVEVRVRIVSGASIIELRVRNHIFDKSLSCSQNVHLNSDRKVSQSSEDSLLLESSEDSFSDQVGPNSFCASSFYGNWTHIFLSRRNLDPWLEMWGNTRGWWLAGELILELFLGLPIKSGQSINRSHSLKVCSCLLSWKLNLQN